MRRIFFALLCTVHCQAQSNPPASERASVDGLVTSAATGLPLSKVTIRLSPAYLQGVAGYHPERTALTNAKGRFSLEDVDPVPYSVSAERAGYANLIVGTGYVGNSMALAPGDRISGIALKLQPQGLI